MNVRTAAFLPGAPQRGGASRRRGRIAPLFTGALRSVAARPGAEAGTGPGTSRTPRYVAGSDDLGEDRAETSRILEHDAGNRLHGGLLRGGDAFDDLHDPWTAPTPRSSGLLPPALRCLRAPPRLRQGACAGDGGTVRVVGLAVPGRLVLGRGRGGPRLGRPGHRRRPADLGPGGRRRLLGHQRPGSRSRRAGHHQDGRNPHPGPGPEPAPLRRRIR